MTIRDVNHSFRWRVNWLAWLVLGAFCGTLAVGLPYLHQVQLERISERIRLRAEAAEHEVALARENQDEARLSKALAEVVRNYDRYLRHRPNDSEMAIRLALAVTEQADFALGHAQVQFNAFRILDRTLARFPDDQRLLTAFGKVAMRLARWPEALSAWSRLQQLQPDNREAALNTARCQLARLQVTDAIRTLRQFLDRDPQCLEAYSLLARCYRHNTVRDNESARQVMEEMLTKNPQSAAAYAHRAAFWFWVADSSQNPEERHEAARLAAADAGMALSLDSENFEALLASAERALRGDKSSDAFELLSRAEKLAPGDERVWGLMVRWARQEGRVDVERSYLERLVRKSPARLPELAEAYLSGDQPDLGKVQEVLHQMQRAQFPAEVLQLWQFRVELAEGQARKIIRPLTELFERSRDRTDALAELAGLTLAQALSEVGASDSAGAILRQLRDRFPQSQRVQVSWANWLLMQGQWDAGFRELESVSSSEHLRQRHNPPRLELARFLSRIAALRGKPSDDPEWSELEELATRLEANPALSEQQRFLVGIRWLEARGQIDEAIKRAREQVTRDNSAATSALLVELLGRAKRIEEALSELAKSEEKLGVQPELLLASLRLAWLSGDSHRRELLQGVMKKATTLESSARQKFLRAALRACLQQGEWDASQQLAGELIEMDAEDQEAHRVLLEVACAQGNFQAAEATLERIKSLEGRFGQFSAYGAALLSVARATRSQVTSRERQRLLEEAKEHVNLARQLIPYWPPLIHLEARIAILEGRLDAASERLQYLEQRGLLGPQGREELAALLLLQGRAAEADQILSSLDASTRLGFQSMKLRAESWLQQGQIQQALDLVKPQIESSSDPLDWLWWGQWLARANEISQADEAFKRARQLAPHLPQVALAYVVHLAATKRSESAKVELDHLQETLEKNTLSYRVLALGYELIGEANTAERFFHLALESSPRDAEILLDWAGFCLRRGQFSECRKTLEKILAAAPDVLVVSEQTRAHARRNLAQLLALSADYRDFQQACRLLEENIQTTGDWTDRCLLARIHAGRPEKSAKQQAIALYQMVLQNRTTIPAEDRFAYAQALTRLGRWPDARLQMRTLFQEVPQPTSAHLAFMVQQLIENRSPGEEIIPFLRQLTARLGEDHPTVIELQLRLAIAQADEESALNRWRQLFQQAIDEKNWQEAAQLALLAERVGLVSAAEQTWNELTGISPSTLPLKAEFLARRHRLDEALKVCEQAQAHLPIATVASTAVNCLRLARTQIEATHAALVAELLQAANAPELKDKRLSLDYASFLNLTGQYGKLPEIYRQLLARSDLTDQEKALLKNNLAYILAAGVSAGQSGGPSPKDPALAEAARLIEEAIAVLGPLGSFLDTRAVVRLRQGQVAGALADARQAVLEEPSPLTYFHLVEALWSLGDRATALRELQRARDAYQLKEESLPLIERNRFREVLAQLSD